MNNRLFKEYISLKCGSEAEKKKTIQKYIPKELRHLPKDKVKEGKFIVKTKLGYYNGGSFVENKIDATIFDNYDDAKKVADCVGKVIKL